MQDHPVSSQSTGPAGRPRHCADRRTVAIAAPTHGGAPLPIRCDCGRRVGDLHTTATAAEGGVAAITTRCHGCHRFATATIPTRTGRPSDRDRAWRCDGDEGCGRYLGTIDAARGRVTVRHRGCAVTVSVSPTGSDAAYGCAA